MKILQEQSGASSRQPTLRSLIGLAVFTLVAVGGYGVFGLNPNLIPDSDFSRQFFGVSFKLFARGQIVVAGVTLAWFLTKYASWRWVPAFLAVAGASFLSEHVGTGYGIPFGGYEYTGLLGYKLGGRVPALIPVSWFLMALPSWILARGVFPNRSGWVGRVLFGAYLLTAWDLALDPAMSYLAPYWIWENPGPFYGMPWVNLAGWMGTGVVLMGLLEILRAPDWTSELHDTWMAAFYGVNLALPVGMLIAAGVWFPVLATAVALVTPFAFHRALTGTWLRTAGSTTEEGST